MLFSLFFEISLTVLGLLYIGDMYFDSIIHMLEVSNEIDSKDKEEQEDKKLSELSKHMYS